MLLIIIFLQFRLAYVDPQSGVFGARYLVDESKKIALNYLHGHFSVDLFTALPLPQVSSFVVPCVNVILPVYILDLVFSAHFCI